MGDKLGEYEAIRNKRDIAYDMLMYDYGEVEKKVVKNRPDINRFYVLPTTFKNLANINIHSNGTVVLQSFDPEPMVIEIKNQALADSYMHYYNDLLKYSKPGYHIADINYYFNFDLESLKKVTKFTIGKITE
jgi:hypothetical protein